MLEWGWNHPMKTWLRTLDFTVILWGHAVLFVRVGCRRRHTLYFYIDEVKTGEMQGVLWSLRSAREKWWEACFGGSIILVWGGSTGEVGRAGELDEWSGSWGMVTTSTGAMRHLLHAPHEHAKCGPCPVAALPARMAWEWSEKKCEECRFLYWYCLCCWCL